MPLCLQERVSNFCVGFGLSKPTQIRQVFEAGAGLAVVGSYLAGVIDQNARGDHLLPAFDEALRPLVNWR